MRQARLKREKRPLAGKNNILTVIADSPLGSHRSPEDTMRVNSDLTMMIYTTENNRTTNFKESTQMEQYKRSPRNNSDLKSMIGAADEN